MTHPDQDALAAFVIGDDSPDIDVHLVESHLQGCPTCQAEVAELRWILRLTEDTEATPQAAQWPIWERISAETSDETSAAIEPPPGSVPDQPAEIRPLRQRRLPVWLAAAAAVVGLLVGGLGVRLLSDAPEPTTVVSRASLDTLDTKTARGEADLVETGTGLSLKITTTSLDAADPDGYLEVWLINRDLKRMVSIGVLGTAGTQSFYVSPELVDQGYVIVDVSREQFDDKPTHSGDSLVRGTLA